MLKNLWNKTFIQEEKNLMKKKQEILNGIR